VQRKGAAAGPVAVVTLFNSWRAAHRTSSEGKDFTHDLALLPEGGYRLLRGQHVLTITMRLSVGPNELTVLARCVGECAEQQQPP
jgi:hypothetical protein